jgi:uncharacterized protein YndB with AHSA1/START domain
VPFTERHLRIAAPIDRVWAVLTDVPGQPRWMRDLRDVRVQTPGALAVGTIAIGRVRMFGLSQEDPIEITALDPPRRYAIAHLGGFRGWGEFWLTSVDDGRATHVRWREDLRAAPDAIPFLPLLFRLPVVGARLEGIAATLLALADPLLSPIFALVFRADLRRLRRLVENGRV